MFTGIVRQICPIVEVIKTSGFTRYSVDLGSKMVIGLEKGASVAIDGVCQTVVRIEGTCVWFDAIEETLTRTTLNDLQPGQVVNSERAARIGDEIGGHLLSGHIYGRAKLEHIERSDNNCVLTFRCPPSWTKYILPKGFIALNGASLTLVDVDPKEGRFTVHDP